MYAVAQKDEGSFELDEFIILTGHSYRFKQRSNTTGKGYGNEERYKCSESQSSAGSALSCGCEIAGSKELTKNKEADYIAMINKLIFFLFSEECMTTESEPCIFPFKHEGKWQRTCIDVENESVCATIDRKSVV